MLLVNGITIRSYYSFPSRSQMEGHGMVHASRTPSQGVDVVLRTCLVPWQLRPFRGNEQVIPKCDDVAGRAGLSTVCGEGSRNLLASSSLHVFFSPAEAFFPFPSHLYLSFQIPTFKDYFIGLYLAQLEEILLFISSSSFFPVLSIFSH